MKKISFIKIFLVFVLIFGLVLPCFAAKHHKQKKKKEKKVIEKVYIFYETDKRDLYYPVKEYVLKHKSVVDKEYSELTFLTILIHGKKNLFEKVFEPHKIKDKDPMIIDMKQFGNDAYIYTRSYDKNFADKFYYWYLKPKYPNSYEVKDKTLFDEFNKDSLMILKSQTPYMNEEYYNPFFYQINMKRYIGFDKKVNKKYAKEEKKKAKKRQKELNKLKKQNAI